VQYLLDGKVSIGLIEGPSRERGVHVEPFMEDELVLIAPPNLDTDHLSRSELAGVSLLMREHGSGSRRVVEKALEKAGFRLKSFKKVIDLDSTEAIKSAVEVGLGMGFVSGWAISNELELGKLKVVQVDGVKITRHFALITPTGPEPQGPTAAFRTFALARARILSRRLQPISFSNCP
jgi:LysR family transcriptional regulator, transcriptional activator of the cysJI operon